VNRIYRSASDELATNCGFQEMPGWSTAHPVLEHLRRENLIHAIGWIIMNSSANAGSNPAGSTQPISGL